MAGTTCPRRITISVPLRAVYSRGASIIAVETVRHETGSIADIAEEIR
jgi:hypothetical protein